MWEAILSAESKEGKENGEGFTEEQKVGLSPLEEGDCEWMDKETSSLRGPLGKNKTY